MPSGRRGTRGRGRRSGKRSGGPPPAPALSCGRDVVGSPSGSDDGGGRRRTGGRRSRGRFDETSESDSASESSSSSESESESESSESESESDSSPDEGAGRRSGGRRSGKRTSSRSTSTPSRTRVVFGPHGATRIAAEEPASAGASSSPAESSEWKSVEVDFRLKGSALDFATGAVKPEMGFTNGAYGIFDSATTSEGRSSAHMCGKVEIIAAQNKSPFSLMLNVAGVSDMGAARSVTGAGQKGMLTMWPNELFSAKDRVMVRSDAEGQKVQFIEDFPGTTLDNIENGIKWLDNGEAEVVRTHPIITMLARSYAARGNKKAFTHRTESPPGKYTLQGETTKRVLDRAKAHMRDVLKQVDLHNISVTLARTVNEKDLKEESMDIAKRVLKKITGDETVVDGDDDESLAAMIKDASWINGAEILDDTTTERGRESKLNEKHTIALKMRITYKTLNPK